MTWIQDELKTVAFASVTATVADTALTMLTFGFTAAELAQAKRAWITVATADILMLWDGSTPVIATPKGHQLPKSLQPWPLVGRANIANLQVIRQAAVSAVVTITLER